MVHRLVSEDARVAALNITVEIPGIDEATEGPQVVEYVREMKQYVEATYPNLKVYLTGIVMMNQAFPEASIYDMTHLVPAAFVAISLLLILFFKSVRFGLLSLIPNIAPAAMAFGLGGLVDGEIGLGLSVVTAMTLGIVVDDTIHFMSKYLRARRLQGLNAIDGIRYAFSTVGIALWTTSVALAAGFLILFTSSFSLNAEMGLLVAIVIMFAIAVDFFLLPALLIRFDRWLFNESEPNAK